MFVHFDSDLFTMIFKVLFVCVLCNFVNKISDTFLDEVTDNWKEKERNNE